MGRGRTNDPEGVRRRLIDAASHAFTTRGFNASAMHDLRRAAGVTGGALAHHFPTKKALGVAVLTDRVTKEVDALWIEPMLASATTRDGVRNVLTGIVSHLRAQGYVEGCPLNNLALELSRQDEDMREAADQIFQRWRATIAAKIRADQAAGRLRSYDPVAAATFIVAAYSGAMTMAKAAQSADPLEACAAQLDVYLAEPATQRSGQNQSLSRDGSETSSHRSRA